MKAYSRLSNVLNNMIKDTIIDKDNDELFALVKRIYESYHYVNVNGEKVFKHILVDDNIVSREDIFMNIPRDYKSFEFDIINRYPDISSADRKDMYIDIKKVFEIIKRKPLYGFSVNMSYLVNEDSISINDDDMMIDVTIKKDIEDIVVEISETKYEDIVSRYNSHWNGFLGEVLDWLVAHRYSVDKKDAWLMILAKSNFGKSLLFKWLEKFNEATFLKIDEFANTGITDKPMSAFTDKTALVFDETEYFPRKMFDVSDYIYIRPMHQHSKKRKVNARVLLSFDGGVLNSDSIDDQIKNRIKVLDLRKIDTKPLDEVMSGYTKAEVENAMVKYLYKEIKKRVLEYDTKRKHKATGAEDYAEDVLKITFKADREETSVLNNKSNFFVGVAKALLEVIENPNLMLSSRVYDEIWNTKVLSLANGDKYILLKPSTLLKDLIADANGELTRELKYKSFNQIVGEIFKDNYNVKKRYYAYTNRLTENREFEKKRVGGLILDKEVLEAYINENEAS